jgi:DNA ligase-1
MIKEIFDQIAQESGDNAKIAILTEYQDNQLIQDVLYNALSKRVKFYLKQIPEYTSNGKDMGLEWALEELKALSKKGGLRGTAASLHLAEVLSSVNQEDAYVVERIIDKRPKINMGRTQINKVFNNLIKKTPYMGAQSYAEKLVRKILEKGSAISQIKMDGRYANAIIRGEELEFESRTGELTILTGAAFLEELRVLTDEYVLNGELTVRGVPARAIANGIVASLIDIQKKREDRGPEATAKKEQAFLKKHTKDFGTPGMSFQDALDAIVYTCWDMITVEEHYNKRSTRPYKDRLAQLKALLKEKQPTRIDLIESRIVTTFREAMEHFQEAQALGLEGTIIKDIEGEWKDGKPNWQVKLKLDMNIDLKAVRYIYGNEGTKNEHVISRIELVSSCGLLKTTPSNMSEDMMSYITENQEELKDAIWEVNCNGLSQNSKGDWSLAHPSIVKQRDDKDTFNSLAEAQEIEEAAKSIV